MNDAQVPRMRTVEEVYGSAFAEEEAFHAELNQSLTPRGFDLMFDLVAALGLPPGSVALDVGAREAYHCILIWCRDVLEHIEDLSTVFREFARVLRPGRMAVIYQMTATERLTPAEAARLWPPAGIHASSVDPRNFEAAITAAGLTIRQCIQLHGEWRERAEEDGTGLSSRQLLWTSRLLRNRPAYEKRFGADAFEAMLSDSLWGVYQMIEQPRQLTTQRSSMSVFATMRQTRLSLHCEQ